MNREFPRSVMLDRHFETVFLEDGSVFFDNIYGKHARIARVNEIQRQVILRIREPIAENALVSELEIIFGPSKGLEIISFLHILINSGVAIVVSSSLDDQNTQLADRFGTEISWLSLGGSPSGGEARFKLLRDASIAIVGLGGAGSLCAMMFAAAGVGKLTLIDGDSVEVSNLSRQLFYTVEDAINRRKKVQCLSDRIKCFTSFTETTARDQFITSPEVASELLTGHDIVVQTADEPRVTLHRWIAQACVFHHIAHIYTFVGQVGPFYIPKRSPCFGCLEAEWRASFPLYDQVVAGHRNKISRQAPSIVSAATQSADFVFSEVLSFITGAHPPLTIAAVAHFRQRGQIEFEAVRRDIECPICRYSGRRP